MAICYKQKQNKIKKTYKKKNNHFFNISSLYDNHKAKEYEDY